MTAVYLFIYFSSSSVPGRLHFCKTIRKELWCGRNSLGILNKTTRYWHKTHNKVLHTGTFLYISFIVNTWYIGRCLLNVTPESKYGPQGRLWVGGHFNLHKMSRNSNKQLLQIVIVMLHFSKKINTIRNCWVTRFNKSIMILDTVLYRGEVE